MQGSDDESEQPAVANNSPLAAGEISGKEYDYLLTMPLWSLTDEKVRDLQAQLKDKEAEYDELEKTAITTLWDRDLETFLTALTAYEEKEERDRLAHKGVANAGKGKRGRARAKGNNNRAAARDQTNGKSNNGSIEAPKKKAGGGK